MPWPKESRVVKSRVGEQTQLYIDDGATRVDVRKLDDNDYLVVADASNVSNADKRRGANVKPPKDE
jgi:pyruvate kinase